MRYADMSCKCAVIHFDAVELVNGLLAGTIHEMHKRSHRVRKAGGFYVMAMCTVLLL